MALRIDTSGLHPTTEACLIALQWLQNKDLHFSNILDMGCGSGILSVVAAHAWDARVVAADIAEKAISDTKNQIVEYGLESRITAIRSDGFSNPLIHERAPYDLILCNMLAEQLKQMANDIKNNLIPNGYSILSGSLAWLAPDIESLYQSLGLEIVETFHVSPWHVYVFCHQSET